MSIFKLVQEAENKAESIKKRAIDDANELLEKTQSEAKKASAQIMIEVEQKEKGIEDETARLIAERQTKVLNSTRRKEEEIVQLAHKNLDRAVDFIISKVFSL